MHLIILLLVLGILLAVVVASVRLAVRLFRMASERRMVQGEKAEAWSCDLYSAAKRAALTWIAWMGVRIVAYAGVGWYDSQWFPARYHYWSIKTSASEQQHGNLR